MRQGKTPISKRPPTQHPGQVLLTQFMKPLGFSAIRLAAALCVSPQRIGEIINGRRGVTAETALRLSRLFGTTSREWLDLQSEYELRQAEEKWAATIEREVETLTITKKMCLSPAVVPEGEKGPKRLEEDRQPPSVRLTGNEKKVHDQLSESPIHFDVLCQRSGLSAGELSAALTMLEISNLVQPRPGNLYSKFVGS